MKKTKGFKKYKRSQVAELRPVTNEDRENFNGNGELKFISDLGFHTVSISEPDLKNGSPKIGDMIARNPDNHLDQWLVAKAYFDKNFIELDDNNSSRYNQLKKRITIWFKEKGIFKKGNPMAQNLKGIEECMELHEALTAYSSGLNTYVNSKRELKNTIEEIKDGIGDRFVTLEGLSQMLGFSLLECGEDAVSIIEKRTGRMENGTFVKDK